MAPRDLGTGAQCKARSGALNGHESFRIGNKSRNRGGIGELSRIE